MMWVVRSDEGGDGRTKMGTNPDRGDLCCGARGVVVRELAKWEEPVPVVLLVVTVDLDILFQDLVSVLSLPVTFRMVTQGEV